MFNKVGNFIKRNKSPILAAVGIIGFGITIAEAVKQTFDFTTNVTAKIVARGLETDKFSSDNFTDDEKIDIAKDIVKRALPVVLLGAASATCIMCSTRMACKDKAAIVGAYGLLREAYDRKIPHVKTSSPIQIKDEDIESVCENDIQTFFDEYSNQYFETSLIKLVSAQSEINHIFIHDGVIGLGTVQKMLGIPVTDPCNAVGWSLDAGEAFYNYDWVQFTNQLTRMDDGLECWIVSIDVPPTADYLDISECPFDVK